jgi:hypothetical protein
MISKKYILLLVLIISNITFSSAIAKSIQWQQIELEEKLKGTFSEYLGLHLDKEQFYVHFKINTKEQSFTLPSHNIKIKSNNKKFISKSAPSSMNADLIALDKVGIFAPQFGTQNNKEMELKLFQYKNKLERDLIKKTNLFEFIENISINIAIDKSVKKEKFEILKKNLSEIIPKFGKIKFDIKAYQIEFKNTEINKLPMSQQIMDKVTGAGSSIGLVFATLIFSLTLIILFSKYKKLQEMIVAESANDGGDEVRSPTMESKELIDSEFRPGSTQLADAISQSPDSMSRFALYLEKCPAQTISLVKKWINLGTHNSKSALYILSERLTVDELTLIFSDLNTYERNHFSTVSNLNITQSGKIVAEKYISMQILEDILSVAFVVDKELQLLLVELTPNQAADISLENTKVGVLLFNLMGVDFISEMIKFLPTEVFNELSASGLSISNEEITLQLEELKTSLEAMSSGIEENSFQRRSVELLKNIDVEKEEQFIKVLIDESKISVLREFVLNSLPASLVFNIDGDLIKNALYKFDLKYKVEFLASVSEELRTIILNKISQEGTKGRDLLDHEVKMILDDKDRLTYIQSKATHYYSDVVRQVRLYVKDLDNTDEVLRDVSSDWLKSIENSNNSSRNEEMDGAAA